MIPQELKTFIEQNCSGKEPSDIIMEAIGCKIEQLGADADEVLAYVEECSKGPTLEQKAERLARVAEAQAKAESDARNAELAADKARQAMAEAESKRATAEALKEQNMANRLKQSERKSKKRTYTIGIIICLLIAVAVASVYIYIHTGKSLAQAASEYAYNQINNENIKDIDIDTSDVPSDDPFVVIDPSGDVKAQLESHYDYVYDLSAGFYKIKKSNKFGLAGKDGKIIQRPKFDYINPKDNNGLMKTEVDKHYGLLNMKGVELVKPEYTKIHEMADGVIKVEKDRKYGLLSAHTLKEITPCIYDYISGLENGLFKVSQKSKIGYLNPDGTINQNPQ